jgi:ribosome-binding factor A
MRRAPDVIFMLDQTEEIEKRINELLHKPSSPEKP